MLSKKSKQGMISFCRLLPKMVGQPTTMLRMSELENPLDLKKSNFGCRDFSGLAMSNAGTDRRTLNAVVSEKPWLLKNSITESGFSPVSKLMRLETETARCGGNPQVPMRYETVNELPLDTEEEEEEEVEMSLEASHGHGLFSEGTSFGVVGEMVLLRNWNIESE